MNLNELNADVAEKVLGWKWEPSRNGVHPPWICCDGVYCGALPEFSRDLDAACSVVREILTRDTKAGSRHAISIEGRSRTWSEPEEFVWEVIFDRGTKFEASASADTLPEAICLAALEMAKHG